jgi:uncharacterized protein (DUF1786 family)
MEQPYRNALPDYPVLAIDVGAGTQDILLHDPDVPPESCTKLVLPSQPAIVARRTARATAERRDVFLHGNLMGGGKSASAVKRHIRAGLRAYATELAAKTISDNLDTVRELGVQIVEQAPTGAVPIETRDVDMNQIERLLRAFEVELPMRIAVAVQDHGHCPDSSNRKFRFAQWRRFVASGGDLAGLAYKEAPQHLTRMRAVQADVPGAVVMDTTSAAIVGCLEDSQVNDHASGGLIIANVGNAHTCAVALIEGRVRGIFEQHTRNITSAKLAGLVEKLAAGTITDSEVFDDGGHGAIVSDDVRARENGWFVAVTGPNRGIARELGYYEACPHGDMMLTGCYGLIRGYALAWPDKSEKSSRGELFT